LSKLVNLRPPSTELCNCGILNLVGLGYVGTMSVVAVIVAGGSGLRAGGGLPKQYQLVGGKPVIRWTLEAFLNHPMISKVQTVIGHGHEALFASATEGLTFLRAPVSGGGSRQDSCRQGLEACVDLGATKVLIHDAARPFLSSDLIGSVISELDHASAVIPGLPVADTMKYAPSGMIERTVDRASLWFVQTPQGFRFDAILAAHRMALDAGQTSFTDDAAVAEFAGMKVQIVAGEQKNRKLTTSHDIVEADREHSSQRFQNLPDVRMGQGIDFHIFEKGNAVTLCGVSVPHTHKLKGHSDADVALHALTDAILGSIGEADIGQHFPPSDKQWKGAPSSIFINKAMDLLAARGGVLSNVDITILAEAPRIGPHLAAMKQSLAQLLNLAVDRIAIKATTTEKMGAIGRKEGMSASAIATVRLPL
jgi:2-C-methyl-D-erythritol 4-phosphate cytidylyltransferase / 2-C-methyl-D-erythritol 2,4-cyclodiphosphate synthase